MAGDLGGLLGGFGGSTLGAVLVEVGLDTRALDVGIAKAKGETEAAGATVSKFGLAAKAAFALAGVAVVGFAASAVRAYTQHQQILGQLSIAVHGNTKELEDNANALQSLTGFQHDEILAADAVLARFHLTQTQIQQLIPHVLDFAQATGRTASDAALVLGKALQGSARGLKDIGITFKATGNAAQDYKTLLDDLSHAAIQGVAAQDNQAKSLRQLSASWQDAKEKFGEFLAVFGSPVLKNAAVILDDLAHPTHVFAYEVTQLTQAQKDSINSNSQLRDGLVQMGDAAAAAGDTLKAHLYQNLVAQADASRSASTATSDLAQAQAAAAQAAKDQAAAEKALVGALPGLIGAVLNLKRAQQDLHKAQSDSSISAADLHDKELAVVTAFAGVQSSFGDIITKYQSGTATMSDVIGKFKEQAAKAGLTKSQIQDLISVVQSYINTLHRVPTSVTTHYSIVTTGTVPPLHGVGTHAAGGFHGMISSPTMMLVGEAGPERVDVTPRGQSSAGVTINIYGDVTDHQRWAQKVQDAVYQGQRRRRSA